MKKHKANRLGLSILTMISSPCRRDKKGKKKQSKLKDRKKGNNSKKKKRKLEG